MIQIPTDLKIYNIPVLSTNFLLQNKFLYILEKTFIPCKLECKYWNEAVEIQNWIEICKKKLFYIRRSGDMTYNASWFWAPKPKSQK